MANEAFLRDRLDNPIDFTVADGTGIEKGALLKLTDPRTASLADGAGDVIAGIAAREKVANNGITQLAVFRKGIFDMLASGAISVGQPVMSAASTTPNAVKLAGGALVSGASIIGHALETATDGEVIQIYVNIGGGVTA
jgi:hypothetical protein